MSSNKRTTPSKANNGIAKGSGSFISFSAVAGNSTVTRDFGRLEQTQVVKNKATATSSQFDDVILLPVYSGNSNDFSVIAKKLLKKDTVTKFKALQDMENMLKSDEINIEEIPDIISYFIFVYSKYVYDNQRSIRLKSNDILQLLLEKNKLAFTKYMKQLIGTWLFAMADPVHEISSSATNSFTSAIPGKKRREATLLQLSQDILKYILLNQSKTVESYKDRTGNDDSGNDNSEECYERMAVTSLNSICKLLTLFSPEARNNLFIASDSDSSLDNPNMKLWSKIQEKVWSFASSNITSIRKASYETLILIAKEVPHTLDVHIDPATSVTPSTATSSKPSANPQKGNNRYAIVLLKMLSESELSLLPLAVQTFITIVTHFPYLWTYIPLKKLFLSKLKDLVLTSPSTILPCLLPLLGSIPPSIASLRGAGIEPLLDFVESISIYLGKKLLAENVVPVTYMAIAEICTILLLRSSPPNTNDSCSSNITEIDAATATGCRTSIGFVRPIDNEINDVTMRRAVTLCSHISNCLISLLSMSAGTSAGAGGTASSSSPPSVLPDVTRTLVQLHRATVTQKILTSSLWSSVLWVPFAQRVAALLRTHSAAIDAKKKEAIAAADVAAAISGSGIVPELSLAAISGTGTDVSGSQPRDVSAVSQYGGGWNNHSDIVFGIVDTLKQAVISVAASSCATPPPTSAGLVFVLRVVLEEYLAVVKSYKYHQDVASDPSVTSKDILRSSSFVPLHAAYVTSILLLELPAPVIHQILSESGSDCDESEGTDTGSGNPDSSEEKKASMVEPSSSSSCVGGVLTGDWWGGLAVLLRVSSSWPRDCHYLYLHDAAESVFQLLSFLVSTSAVVEAAITAGIAGMLTPLFNSDCIIGVTLYFRYRLHTVLPDYPSLLSRCCTLVDKWRSGGLRGQSEADALADDMAHPAFPIHVEFLSYVLLLQYDLRKMEKSSWTDSDVTDRDGARARIPENEWLDVRLLRWYEASYTAAPLFALLTVFGQLNRTTTAASPPLAGSATPTDTPCVCADFGVMLPLLVDSLLLYLPDLPDLPPTPLASPPFKSRTRRGLLTRNRESCPARMTGCGCPSSVPRGVVLALQPGDHQLYLDTVSQTLGNILSSHCKTGTITTTTTSTAADVLAEKYVGVTASQWVNIFRSIFDTAKAYHDKMCGQSVSVSLSPLSSFGESTRIASPALWQSVWSSQRGDSDSADFDSFLFDVAAELVEEPGGGSWLPILSDTSLLIQVMCAVKCVQSEYLSVDRGWTEGCDSHEGQEGEEEEKVDPTATKTKSRSRSQNVQIVEQYCKKRIASSPDRMKLVLTLSHILFRHILSLGTVVGASDSEHVWLEAVVLDLLSMVLEEERGGVEGPCRGSSDVAGSTGSTGTAKLRNLRRGRSDRLLTKTRKRLPVQFLLHSEPPGVAASVWVVQAVPEPSLTGLGGGEGAVERLVALRGMLDSITHSSTGRGSSGGGGGGSTTVIQVTLAATAADGSDGATTTTVDGTRLLVVEPLNENSWDLIELDEPSPPAPDSLFASLSRSVFSLTDQPYSSFSSLNLFEWLGEVVANLESLFRPNSGGSSAQSESLARLTTVICHLIRAAVGSGGAGLHHIQPTAAPPAAALLLIARLRGMTVRLLSADLIAKPDKVCCGLRLLQLLLPIPRCLGSGLWLGRALSCVRGHIQSLRVGVRLLLRPEETGRLALELCRTQTALLDVIDCASLVEGAENLVALTLSFLSISETTNDITDGSSREDGSSDSGDNGGHLEHSCIDLLRALWEFQQDPKHYDDTKAKKGRDSSSSSKESSAIERLKAKTAAERRVGLREGGWESAGLKYAVQSLLRWGEGSHSLRHAIYFCLLNRSRKEASELVLAASVSTFENDLLDIVLGGEAVFGDRIVAVKLLDVLYISGNSSGGGSVDLSERVTLDESGGIVSDISLFEAVVGRKLSNYLNTQYSQTMLLENSNASVTTSISGKEGGKGYEDGGDKEGDEIADSSSSDSEERDEEKETDRAVASRIRRPLKSPRPARRRYPDGHRDGEEDKDDGLGLCLAWLLCLQRISSSGRDENGVEYRLHLGDWLTSSGLVPKLLSSLIAVAPHVHRYRDMEGYLQRVKPHSDEHHDISKLAAYSLFRSVCELPALSRGWWSDLPRCPKNNVMKFVADSVAVALIRREVAAAAEATRLGLWDSEELVVTASVVSREVVARYLKEEARIELRVALPCCYPLENVVVDSSSRVGVMAGRGDRWKLQISQRLASENGSIVDAILMWKRNVDSELEGVEPCPICFSTLHAKHLSIPSLRCKTCKNKFHNHCLYHWFETSGKSKCVICQEPFIAS